MDKITSTFLEEAFISKRPKRNVIKKHIKKISKDEIQDVPNNISRLSNLLIRFINSHKGKLKRSKVIIEFDYSISKIQRKLIIPNIINKLKLQFN